MQLPIAALQLLTALAARSSSVMSWLQSQADELLLPLLPLVFHPLHSVRRAMARFLGVVVLGAEALKSMGFRALAGGVVLPDGVGHGVLLPQQFLVEYKMPFKVEGVDVGEEWVGAVKEVKGLGLSSDERENLHSVPISDKEDLRGLPDITPSGLVKEGLRNLVMQQRLLKLMAGGVAGALEGVGAVGAQQSGCLSSFSSADLAEVPQAVLAATTANAAALDAAATANRLLEAVAAAGSHADCSAAIRKLLLLGSCDQGLLGICRGHWREGLGRLLRTSPVTWEDQVLWLLLLQLVQKMVLSGGLQAVSAPSFNRRTSFHGMMSS